ncbi:hypothetical protein N9L68_01480 [bacterium]|nr:hypothetical protein [bacterium]
MKSAWATRRLAIYQPEDVKASSAAEGLGRRHVSNIKHSKTVDALSWRSNTPWAESPANYYRFANLAGP